MSASPRVVLRLVASESDVTDAVHELVTRARRGDASAWLALYDEHAPYLHAVLLRVLGPDAELADVLQEVFLEAVRSIARLEHASRVRDWLVTIAVYRARALIRRRKRSSWLSFRAALEPELPRTELGADLDSAVRALYRTLAKLPEELRVAFALRHVAGLELTEVAAACDVSLATVKRWLGRAEQAFVAAAGREPALESHVERVFRRQP